MEENEKKSPESESPKPERKPAPLGGNLTFYIIAVGVVTLLLLYLWKDTGEVVIDWSHLKQLIDKGLPEDNPDAAIEVTREIEGKKGQITYRLREGDNLLIGHLDEVLELKAGEPVVRAFQPAEPTTRT